MAPPEQRVPRRRAPIILTALAVVAAVIAAIALGPQVAAQFGWNASLPTMRATVAPAITRSVSIDFGYITDPKTDWAAIDRRLDQAGVTTVNLNAGRVEFTAFDWSASPAAAAEAGTDHLAVAARALNTGPQGQQRPVNLIVDAYVPEWIKSDPSIAGVSANGRAARYTASATQLAEGAVGQRLADYVAALGQRYDPNRIELTELFLDTYSFGADDLQLFRRLTGAADWPRNDDGSIDTSSSEIGLFRSQAIAKLLTRVRTALDAVREGAGRDIELAMDVRINWDDLAGGPAISGQAYRTLMPTRAMLQPWVYLGLANKQPQDVVRFTEALKSDGLDTTKFVMSVGLWRGPANAEPPGRITPDTLEGAVRAAATNGVRDVNVTPYSLMTDDHWTALARAWG